MSSSDTILLSVCIFISFLFVMDIRIEQKKENGIIHIISKYILFLLILSIPFIFFRLGYSLLFLFFSAFIWVKIKECRTQIYTSSKLYKFYFYFILAIFSCLNIYSSDLNRILSNYGTFSKIDIDQLVAIIAIVETTDNLLDHWKQLLPNQNRVIKVKSQIDRFFQWFHSL